MKTLEYGIVTSVLKDDDKGAQLCHVKGQLTDREYKFCEVMTPRGISSLPKAGDTVIVCELHNAEIVILNVLEQYDLSLEAGEVLLHYGTIVQEGQIKKYRPSAKIKLNKDNAIEMVTGTYTGNVFTQQNRILLETTGKITIEGTNDILICSDTKISLDAPIVEVI